jgi:phosphate transport system substrate-binding protein
MAGACARTPPEESGSAGSAQLTIQNAGSDTMVNLAQAWAEEYATVDPTVSVEVSGGGSGTGIAALINGTVDVANSSRKLEPEEAVRAKEVNGADPREHVVGYDALAVYVHKDNPLGTISLDQLGEIYGEGGKLEKWSELGVSNAACPTDEIIRVSRQSNSGTYFYFREAILGKTRDFKLGSRDLHGSKDVVDLVAGTPCAIGYSGMGYATPEVKALEIARKTGDQAFTPSIETTLDGSYPIARPLYLYNVGDPPEHVARYLEWLYSERAQAIVAESGYVPLPKDQLPTSSRTQN